MAEWFRVLDNVTDEVIHQGEAHDVKDQDDQGDAEEPQPDGVAERHVVSLLLDTHESRVLREKCQGRAVTLVVAGRGIEVSCSEVEYTRGHGGRRLWLDFTLA